MRIKPSDIYRVLDVTWPSAQARSLGPWRLRQGLGGGSRVSATTLHGQFSEPDIDRAEEAMIGMGQDLLFMIRDGDDRLAQVLLRRGYRVWDPVTVYASGIECLVARHDNVRVEWPPAPATREVWRTGGIDDARVAVMERAECPKASLVTDWKRQPASCAYVGVADAFSMIHAIETLAAFRRKGLARRLLSHAAYWAERHGARWIVLLTRDENHAANMLYKSLGMTVAGNYFYCIRERHE